MDNRTLWLGWSMGRCEEVPSWKPYEDDRINEEPVEECEEMVELPFEL